MTDGALSSDERDGYNNEPGFFELNISRPARIENQNVAEMEETIRRFDPNNVGSDIESLDTEEDELYSGNRAPPEFYRQGMKSLNENDFKRKYYAKSIFHQIARCKLFWHQFVKPFVIFEFTGINGRSFCSIVLHKEDWEGCLASVDFATVYHFLLWYMNQRTGSGGRKKQPVKKMSILFSFWCGFRLFYERLTTQKIDNQLPHGVMSNVQGRPYPRLLAALHLLHDHADQYRLSSSWATSLG